MTWIVFKLQEIGPCKGQAQKFQGLWRASNLSAWWWVSEVLVGQVQFIYLLRHTIERLVGMDSKELELYSTYEGQNGFIFKLGI